MSQECSCFECRLADEAWEINEWVDRVPYIPTDTDTDFLPAWKVVG